MSFSRRKFLKAGAIATAFAALPLKSVLADGSSQWQSSGISDQLRYYNSLTFAPYVNTKFGVFLSPTNTRILTLTEVSDSRALTEKREVTVSSGVECFSLMFTIPPGKPFDQDTYLVKHDALGSFYMFVVPVSLQNDAKPDYYEAIFYRRPQTQRWQETIDINDNRASTTATPAPQGQSQSPVYGAVPLIVLQGTREERDVYRFRPEKLEPKVDDQAKAKLAKKKEIYRLTLAQAPVVNGLNLGMTPDQVLALFPGSKTDKEVRFDLDRPPTRFGVSTFTIRPEKYSSASKFEGITEISFMLFDGRVSTMYVGYDGPLWEHVDEFVTKFAEKRNLPAADAYWESYLGMDDQLKTLKSKEVEISLFAGGKNLAINYVQMRDLVALKKYKERSAKAKADSE